MVTRPRSRPIASKLTAEDAEDGENILKDVSLQAFSVSFSLFDLAISSFLINIQC
jgi:hypothetical protein